MNKRIKINRSNIKNAFCYGKLLACEKVHVKGKVCQNADEFL